ncbi:MAG: hypothetical protein L6Q72_10390, partial [Burkholderiaceae bacterium]|nr:hypothetical protein [Burkholderiaceae bacterium]
RRSSGLGSASLSVAESNPSSEAIAANFAEGTAARSSASRAVKKLRIVRDSGDFGLLDMAHGLQTRE